MKLVFISRSLRIRAAAYRLCLGACGAAALGIAIASPAEAALPGEIAVIDRTLVDQLLTERYLAVMFGVMALVFALRPWRWIISNSSGRFRRKQLLGPDEMSFLEVLDKASAGRFRVFSKVRLNDLVQPRWGGIRAGSGRETRCLKLAHLDFVVCDAVSLVVVGVIEMSEESHFGPIFRKSDFLKESALESANIPLLRIPTGCDFTVPVVREMIVKMLMAAVSGIPIGPRWDD